MRKVWYVLLPKIGLSNNSAAKFLMKLQMDPSRSDKDYLGDLEDIDKTDIFKVSIYKREGGYKFYRIRYKIRLKSDYSIRLKRYKGAGLISITELPFLMPISFQTVKRFERLVEESFQESSKISDFHLISEYSDKKIRNTKIRSGYNFHEHPNPNRKNSLTVHIQLDASLFAGKRKLPRFSR